MMATFYVSSQNTASILSISSRSVTVARASQLFGTHLEPEAPRLEHYAGCIEVALWFFKDAGKKGSVRPFYLLSMSHYLRTVYPENWCGQGMNKAVNAYIRDFVNAGFRAYRIDKDVSEDQIRHLCERFQKGFPALAKLAEEQSRIRPTIGQNIYERLFQDAFRSTPDSSAE